jgi:hypothetical protein
MRLFRRAPASRTKINRRALREPDRFRGGDSVLLTIFDACRPGVSGEIFQAKYFWVCWIIADLRERVFHRAAVQAQQLLCADSCRCMQLKCPPGGKSQTKTLCPGGVLLGEWVN